MISGLHARLAGAAALVLFIAWGLWRVHSDGKAAGEAAVRAEWRKATQAAQAETDKLRAEGYKLAAEYIAQLRELETRYARTNARLRDALNSPIACPASGRLGDLVIPAAVVDGMFLRDAESAASPGPSASQPDRAVP